RQRQRVQHWRSKLDAVLTVRGKSQQRVQARHQLNKATLALAQAEEEAVRHSEEQFFSAMIPPHSGWTLRAARTLNVNGKHINRGAEISVEALAQMANAPAMLSGGHIRWMPPTVPRPAPAPISARPAAPVGPRNPPRDPAGGL